ncbi:MAG: hypothetical protein IPH13_07625 [Planctomycetes bacterium]|nr:hypothetical protein [Planctomycetota bacterium]MCC7173169.1 hypothetical protein [Planctomycetota bacterium]
MRSTSFVVLSVVLGGSVFGQASAQCVDPFQQSFVAPVGAFAVEFTSIANTFVAPQAITMSGNRAFIAGRQFVSGKTVGVAYEYLRQSNGTWSPGSSIVGPPIAGNSPQYFADRLALDGDRLVVGGSKIQNAWIYERIGGVWTQVKHVPQVANGDALGSALAIDGDTVVIGARESTHPTLGLVQSGAAYVFERVAGSWVATQTLLPATPISGAHFGTSITLDGDTLVISATSETTGPGSVGALHVFERQGSQWTQTARLTAASSAPGSIGHYVDLDGDTLAVSSNGTGALVFERIGPFWFQSHQLVPPGSFGPGGVVALDGPRLAVSDPSYPLTYQNRGAVHLYERVGSAWIPRQFLHTPDAIGGTDFGQSLDLLGDVLLAKCPNAGNPPNSMPATILSFSTIPNPPPIYGAGCAGSGAIVPTLSDLASYDGCFVDGASVSYRVAQGLGGSTCVLLISPGMSNVPLANGCSLLVAPSPLSVVVPLFGVGPGGGSITLNASIPVGVPAASIFMQGFVLDGGAPGGYAATNGMRLTVQ